MTKDDQSRAREMTSETFMSGVVTPEGNHLYESLTLLSKALAHIAALERALGSFVEYFDAIEAGALNHNRRTAPLRTVEQIYLDRGRELLGWKKREASGE